MDRKDTDLTDQMASLHAATRNQPVRALNCYHVDLLLLGKPD